MTDAELDVASARMARLLERRGLGPGDRVGVMLPNVPEFAVAYLEGYGLSQTSPVASFNHPDRERKPGSIGTPIQGVEMKAVDEARHEVAQGDVGEIAIPGHNVMKSHWARPEATAEAIDGHGWFYTGDIARVDEDGYFFIVDRKKELIIRGGYNVYPREIEEVLYEHPAVLEAAVIGVPHAELGEEGGAAVALVPGAQVGERKLRDYLKSQVAAYKYPRHGIAPNVSYTPQPGPPTRKSLIARIDPSVPGFLNAVAPDHRSKVADGMKIG
jgi:acyl-CoA synthetase (AMP-forming)/AMP-acid ligase II